MNAKNLVRHSYNQIAQAYESARRQEPHEHLDLLVKRLVRGARVLDLGCGHGIPISRALSRKFEVIGIDLSEEMVRRARQNVPLARFLVGDMLQTQFPKAHFSAVVAHYSIFHLPRTEHQLLFERISTWLEAGGYLLATLTNSEEEAYTEDDFFGATMYWSHYGLGEYEDSLAHCGLEILTQLWVGHGYDPDVAFEPEEHPLILAQKVA